MKRIKYIIDANPNGTWENWIERAYFDRISLSATGFHRTPDIGYDFEKNTGILFDYFTYGAACSEIEIDCLTGDHQVIILNKINKKLNLNTELRNQFTIHKKL
jgi:xanthine dehydrogenase/oxidase